MRRFIVALTAVVVAASSAGAFGEIFLMETTGTEYCGNFNSTRFNANNNVYFWVSILDANSVAVSLTPFFVPGTTFLMTGRFYRTKPTAAEFIGGVTFLDGSFATIEGTASVDRRTNAITKVKGVFIQDSVFFDGCFSSGKFKSVK